MFASEIFGVCVILSGLRYCHGRRIFDLTHTLDLNPPQWPLGGLLPEDKESFKLTPLTAARYENYWVALSYVEIYEHVGTHIDAPIHTSEGRQTLEQIPAEKLMGPGVIFDIKDKAKENPDYLLSVADIESYESMYGRIPFGAIVVINSGWSEKYPRPELVFGTEMINDTRTFHFPGYSMEAAEFLFKERGSAVFGTDCPSIDYGREQNLRVHQYLQSFDVPLLEYVAHLDAIPPNGTTIFLGAVKFKDGTGGATRILAVLDDPRDTAANRGTRVTTASVTMLVFTTAVLYVTMSLPKN